jgi:hypothetical protein
MDATDQHGFDETALKSIGERLLDVLARGDLPPVHTSADGLVRLTMSPGFELTSLTLEGVDLRPQEQTRLAHVLTTAINDAIRALASAHEARFRALTAPADNNAR